MSLDQNIEMFGARMLEVSQSLGAKAEPTDTAAPSVASRRRRRERLASQKTIALYEVDGLLHWEEEAGLVVPSAAARRRRRASDAPMLEGNLVTQFVFEELPPNKISDFLSKADQSLTPKQGLHKLEAPKGDVDHAEWVRLDGNVPDVRTLLLVHGTFSSLDNFLEELRHQENPDGRTYLSESLRTYGQVLGFGHPTLAVSPILNGVDLERLFANVRSEVHVIAHSRGGLVTRWWLDGLGGAAAGPRRAVLVGAPMSGTSLASPASFRATMDLLTNFARGLELAGAAASTVLPFMSVATVIGRVVKSVAGTLAKTPIADAAIALVPGLFGQSRVGNNFELQRLRTAPFDNKAAYYSIESNFEPTDPGWKFWRHFRPSNLLDMGADILFEGPNDLVVETASMTQIVAADKQPLVDMYSFGANPRVHHCNYFRQPETFAKLRAWLAVSSPSVSGGVRIRRLPRGR